MTRKNKSPPPPHFFHCAINGYSLLFIFLLVKLLLYLKVFPVLWSNSGYQALEGISWEILLSCYVALGCASALCERLAEFQVREMGHCQQELRPALCTESWGCIHFPLPSAPHDLPEYQKHTHRLIPDSVSMNFQTLSPYYHLKGP